MSTLTEAVREQLMAGNENYQNLLKEHTRYAAELDKLSSKSYLNEDEKMQEVRLKKLKLRVKDEMERLVREVRSALHRRKREELAVQRVVAEQMHSEMRETLTAMLLSCELAMSAPDVPVPVAERIRAIDNLARELRLRLQMN
jgi:uncharacterized protein YdcH (DUF465 family)